MLECYERIMVLFIIQTWNLGCYTICWAKRPKFAYIYKYADIAL
jgi:hypothetical protein